VVNQALLEHVDSSQAQDVNQLLVEVQDICAYLIPVLPPYAPPLNNINQVLLVLEDMDSSCKNLGEVKKQLAKLDDTTVLDNIHEQIANYLIPILSEQVTIYTHTLSETLLGVLLALHKLGIIKKVYVTESRPNNDGWITARKLVEAGVETYITLDMGFPAAIDQADVMLSGTEIINPDGSVVCKVGIYPAAIYCKMVSKAFYIIADAKKISPIHSQFLHMTVASLADMGMSPIPDGLTPAGCYFDKTPSRYVTGYVTDSGFLTAEDVFRKVKNQPVSVWLKSQIEAILQ